MKFRKHLPAQFYSAERYLKSFKDQKIIISGYSLGGSIAQMLGCKYTNLVITYEAYGVGDLITGSGNIINFGNIYDPVFMDNFNNQVGQLYIIPIKKYTNNTNLFLHFPGLYGKPSNAQKFSGNLNDYKINTVKVIKNDAKAFMKKSILKEPISIDLRNKGKNIIQKYKDDHK